MSEENEDAEHLLGEPELEGAWSCERIFYIILALATLFIVVIGWQFLSSMRG